MPTSASSAGASCNSARGCRPAQREIDAAGRDRHAGRRRCALPPRPADGAAGCAWPTTSTAARARAACGGTTTVIPFAAQEKGQSLRAAVDDYHHRAEGKAHVDYAFHLIVSDPTPQVLNEELPALIARGLHVVQDLHDLRRPEARRRPDPRRAGGGAAARRDGDDPRRERRLHRVADRSSSRPPGAPRRASMRTRGRCWSSARPRTARSRWPNWSTCRSSSCTSRAARRSSRSAGRARTA